MAGMWLTKPGHSRRAKLRERQERDSRTISRKWQRRLGVYDRGMHKHAGPTRSGAIHGWADWCVRGSHRATTSVALHHLETNSPRRYFRSGTTGALSRLCNRRIAIYSAYSYPSRCNGDKAERTIFVPPNRSEGQCVSTFTEMGPCGENVRALLG